MNEILKLILMKNQLFLVTIGILISTGCYAQNSFPKGISKVKGEQFQVSYVNHGDLIVVYNVKSKHAKGGPASDNPNALPLSREDIHFDVAAANAIIQEVLKAKIKKLHQNEDFINYGITFERSGKISDISYGVKKSTLIKLEDIADIDARLRSAITATYTGKVYKDYKYFTYEVGTIEF